MVGGTGTGTSGGTMTGTGSEKRKPLLLLLLSELNVLILLKVIWSVNPSVCKTGTCNISQFMQVRLLKLGRPYLVRGRWAKSIKTMVVDGGV